MDIVRFNIPKKFFVIIQKTDKTLVSNGKSLVIKTNQVFTDIH